MRGAGTPFSRGSHSEASEDGCSFSVREVFYQSSVDPGLYFYLGGVLRLLNIARWLIGRVKGCHPGKLGGPF